MKTIDLAIPKGAIFSGCGRFRYALWRLWSPKRPTLLFIGLNPSKASSTIDDPTVIRMMARSAQGGFGALLVANLYAMVSTDPKQLLDTTIDDTDVVGPETDDYLHQLIDLACPGRVLCGWGSFEPVPMRAPAVLAMIPEPYCLGVNADGQPKHPLYIGYDVAMVRYVKKEPIDARA